MYETYLKNVTNYKADKFNLLKESFEPNNRHLATEDYAITEFRITMKSLALKDNSLLFRQLFILTDLLQSQYIATKQPLSKFLNIEQSFKSNDQSNQEITYFVKPRIKQVDDISLDLLFSIWNIIHQLQKYQIFLFNLSASNFTKEKHLISDLNNLIVIKTNQKTIKSYNMQIDSCFIKKIGKRGYEQLIKNSYKIIKSESFFQFAKSLNPNIQKGNINLNFLYYLHRLQFYKFVKIIIERFQNKKQRIVINDLIEKMKNILKIQPESPYKIHLSWFDDQINNILRQIIDIEAFGSPQKIEDYYSYPQTPNFESYTEQEQSILVHACRQLIDSYRFDINLLQDSFNLIFDPRDYLYLQSNINALYQQQILQQKCLLQLQDSINFNNKQKLGSILKQSKEQIVSIFKQAKLKSLKIDFQKARSIRPYDKTDLLYRNHRSYKKQIETQDRKKQCEPHRYLLQYQCECSQNKRQLYCYFCIQERHRGHKALCHEHRNKFVVYILQTKDKKGQTIYSFACQICKQQSLIQEVKYTRICPSHKILANYFCLSLQCQSHNLLCIQCLKIHKNHQTQIAKIPQTYQNQDENAKTQYKLEKKSRRKLIQNQQFSKMFQIYSKNMKLVEYFLNQLEEQQNQSKDYRDYLKHMIDSQQNLEENQDLIIKIKFKKILSSFNYIELRQLRQFFLDKIEVFNTNLFENIKKLIQQFQKKTCQMIFDEQMLQHAHQYLNNKYETILNTRNAQMQQVMLPYRLSQSNISQHHYSRIKRVIINQVVDKEDTQRLNVQKDKHQNQKMAYLNAKKQSWIQFYKADNPQRKQYQKIEAQIKHLYSSDLLYQRNIITKKRKQLNQKLNTRISILEEQLLQNQLSKLQEADNDGQYLYMKLHEIEQKVQQIAEQLFLIKQNPRLVQFELVKNFPNIQYCEFKLLENSQHYQWLTSREVSSLFNSSNLNYFYFEYMFQISNLSTLLSFIHEQHFNKKITFYINDDNYSTLNKKITPQNQKALTQLNHLLNNFNFGFINLEISLTQQDEQFPQINNIINLLDYNNNYRISMEFDQTDENGEKFINLEYGLNQQQQIFLNQLFSFLASKSQLFSLTLIQLPFSEYSNRIFSDLLHSNYLLKQLEIYKCQNLCENCFKNLNKQLEVFQLSNTRFEYPFRGDCLSAFTHLKSLHLQGISLDIKFLSLKSLKIQKSLLVLTLNDLFIDSIYDYKVQKSQYHTYRKLFSTFKNCSIRHLQIKLNCLNPFDLLVLESLELINLTIYCCHKLTQDFFKALSKKWPNLEYLDFHFSSILSTRIVQICMLFKDAIQISLGKHQITPYQTQKLRENGKYVKVLIT